MDNYRSMSSTTSRIQLCAELRPLCVSVVCPADAIYLTLSYYDSALAWSLPNRYKRNGWRCMGYAVPNYSGSVFPVRAYIPSGLCRHPTEGNISYNFAVPNQAGTFWYHSHLSTQYCDGLRYGLKIPIPIQEDSADPYPSAARSSYMVCKSSYPN